MNAVEMPVALSKELSNPSRCARTRMALDTLTQSMQEGDGKIIDLEYKNSELQRELQVARTTLADVRAALENAHNDVGALTQELTTVCAELASSGRPREKIVAVVSPHGVLSQRAPNASAVTIGGRPQADGAEPGHADRMHQGHSHGPLWTACAHEQPCTPEGLVAVGCGV